MDEQSRLKRLFCSYARLFEILFRRHTAGNGGHNLSFTGQVESPLGRPHALASGDTQEQCTAQAEWQTWQQIVNAGVHAQVPNRPPAYTAAGTAPCCHCAWFRSAAQIACKSVMVLWGPPGARQTAPPALCSQRLPCHTAKLLSITTTTSH